MADDDRVFASDRDRGEGRAHPGERIVAGRLLDHGTVRFEDRFVERTTLCDRGAQRLDRSRARDLTGPVATHAVGDREELEPDLDEEPVFVAVAHLADVGGRADDELHRTTRMTVSPNFTVSPLRMPGDLVDPRAVDEASRWWTPRSSTSISGCVGRRGRGPARRRCRR